ncbi:MAG TPA: M20/M25/M40 family metallo-hydrolase [Candidatus Angelobacter sp.]|nr:M20/M25/M40 family metallo-hydrolase [Candidatus Angelobacter sp.]
MIPDLIRGLIGVLLFTLSAATTSPTRAQFPPVKKDPLAPAQSPQSPAACSAADASSCAQVAAKLLPIVMGPSPMEENLRRLTDEIGGRVTGSPEMDEAVRWAVGAFRAAGVEVHTEKYTLPVAWRELQSGLMIQGPFESIPREVPTKDGKIVVVYPGHNVPIVSEGWGPPTPADGIIRPLVDVGYGTASEFAHARKDIEGAILLVHSDIGSTWADLFNEYLQPPAIIDHAVKGGAAAILWMGAREHKLLYRHTNSLNGDIDRIPQAVVAREDAMRLARLAAAYPGEIKVRLWIDTIIGGPVEQQNVVGEIRGYEKPDEVVILGAHLDSWELGTGALDNGCNAALVIEAARAIKATGLLPRRTIRFVLFSGEEQGTIGSYEYVKSHRAELDKMRAMITFDEGVGRVTGYSLGGRRDTEVGLREVLKPLESWGANNHTYDASFGSDNFDFLLEGVPTLMANQEEANYLPNYHAASDTLDKVDMRELKLHTVIAALTAWGIADRTEPLGKRLTRAEIETQMKETGVDQQMKLLGYWEAWEKGQRGRKP